MRFLKLFFKKCILFLLAFRAQKIIHSGADIIAITGSMGKTTTKDFVAGFLAKKFTVVSSVEGFNTPIGVLLSLLGEKHSGNASVLQWIKILLRVYVKKIHIPQKIVLEYGVDRLGDMDDLLRIAQPDVALFTNVAPVHLGIGHFQKISDILREKSKLPKAVPESGLAVLNGDDEYIKSITTDINAKKVLYGKTQENTVRILDERYDHKGMSFVFAGNGERFECHIPVWGSYFVSAVAPAIFLARKYGVSFEHIEDVLKCFAPAAGRGRIFEGLQNSIIWDQSYNSNPKALQKALQDFKHLPGKRKITLLGTMNELGEDTSIFHYSAGKQAAEVSDIVLFVGSYFSDFQKGVHEQDNTTEVLYFSKSIEAGEYLKNILQEGDTLLAKGSQAGVFLEKAIEKILKNKKDSQQLCRRGDEWKNV